jgi:hypothetical protein
MTQQYGTLKVDFITFTSGTTGNETDVTLTVSGLSALSDSGMTITGDITARNVTATGTLSGATITGDILNATSITGVTGVFTTLLSGASITGELISGTSGIYTYLSGASITGNLILGTSGVFTNVTGTTINSVTGSFTTGTFSNLGITGTITGNTVDFGIGAFATSTSTTGYFPDTSGTSAVGSVAFPFASGVFTNLIVNDSLTATLTTGLFGSGTESAPSISFDDDRDTGFYNAAANEVRITTSGNDRLTVDSTGNVGIGITSPTARLYIANDQGGAIGRILIDANVTSGYDTRIDATDDGLEFSAQSNIRGILFNTGGTPTERLRITGNGNVGIGTTDPGAKLEIKESTYSTKFSGDVIDFTKNNVNFLKATGGSFGALGFSTGGDNERLRITSDGKVGIGTSNPGYVLETVGDILINPPSGNAVFRLGRAGSNDWAIYNDTLDNLVFFSDAGGAERARIDSSGRLLVGTSASLNGGEILQARTTAAANTFGIYREFNDTAGPRFSLVKTRGSSTTIVNNGDLLGTIRFQGSDGTDTNSIGASIDCAVDGTPGANDMPGRLVFSTTGAGTTPTERMRIASSGKIAIGTTAPAGYPGKLIVVGDGTVCDREFNSRVASSVSDAERGFMNVIDGVEKLHIYSPNSGDNVWEVGGTERFRIASDGNVGIGTSAPAEKLQVNGGILFATANRINSGSSDRGNIQISSPNEATNRSVSYGNNYYINTSGNWVQAATNIGGSALELRANNGNYGEILFRQKQDPDSGGAERIPLVINTAGNVGIGTSSPDTLLHLSSATGSAAPTPTELRIATTTTGSDWSTTDPWGRISFYSADGLRTQAEINTTAVSTTGGASSLSFSILDAGASPVLREQLRFIPSGTGLTETALSTSGTERVRIDSSGNVGIGTSTPGEKLEVDGSVYITDQLRVNKTSFSISGSKIETVVGGNQVGIAVVGSTSNVVRVMLSFHNPDNTNVGQISIKNSITTYSTSSDYRLKENVVNLTGAIDRLKLIDVYRFNFIGHEPTVDGFIAHELQDVVPECVTGTKDEVDDEGNPVYQGIDQSKIVPLLTAALQEALAKIETLEQRLTDAGL